MMKIRLKGCSGIQNPVDMHGQAINVGDRLSWDYGDYHQGADVESWMKEPMFVVEPHPSGRGLCAVGIEKPLYLHDFRFKHCELVA